MADIESLVARLKTREGFIDPPKVHHQFADKMHGRKVDWGAAEENEEDFSDWIEVTTDEIGDSADIIAAVANGTTELTIGVAERLHEVGHQVLIIVTHKLETREVVLSNHSKAQLALPEHQGKRVKILDDEGTTGSTTAHVAQQIQQIGEFDISVLYSEQRRPQLEHLDELGIAYKSLRVATDLPTFTPEDCHTVGYCAQGWNLIEHGK